MSDILNQVEKEILSLNLKTGRRLSAFRRLVVKLTSYLGNPPTDQDLRRLSQTVLNKMATNDAERNVVRKILLRMGKT